MWRASFQGCVGCKRHLSCSELPHNWDFLAYQFVTDINYSEITDFSEMDFVVPGPGARDGLKKCFADSAGLNDAESYD